MDIQYGLSGPTDQPEVIVEICFLIFPRWLHGFQEKFCKNISNLSYIHDSLNLLQNLKKYSLFQNLKLAFKLALHG